MAGRAFHSVVNLLLIGLLTLAAVPGDLAQSNAFDAQIEGLVSDPSGGVIPGAQITGVNQDTGIRRTAVSNEDGLFSFPILPLGDYILTCEFGGFKTFERSRITLSAGKKVWVAIELEAGNPQETVTVTSENAVADESRVDVGRQINTRDVKDLPLVSRNPLNFALLQPGVTGRTTSGPQAVGLSSNGLLRRAAYGLDGGYNNDSDVAGFRLSLTSEVFVKEVQLFSSGYSAEFGNTAGTVVNVITPTGSNRFSGTFSALWRPAFLSAKPIGFVRGMPEPNVDGWGVTTAVGGPIVKDRWQFYAGYERSVRKTLPVMNISPANQQALINAGSPSSIFFDSEGVTDLFPYVMVRNDISLSKRSRLAIRYNRFDADLRNGGPGGVNTTERSFDRFGWDHAIAAQVVSEFSYSFFNEFRSQRIERVTGLRSNAYSGSGVSINISNAANLGPNQGIGALDTNQSSMQFNDAITKVFDRHLLKLGGGFNFIRDTTLLSSSATYTFPSVNAYVDAVNGINTRSYSSYQESFGIPSSPFNSYFINLFIQDDWKATRTLKVSAGLRYDLYLPPNAIAGSPLEFSKKFRTDPNNLGPRLGIAYLLRDGRFRTVIRGGSGLHYDPPLLRMYRRATQNNGDPRFFSYSFGPGTPGGPSFPNTVGSLPPGTTMLRRDVDAVAPEFSTMYALHSNLQVEQVLAKDLSVTAGFLHSIARHIPVYRNINCRPVGGTLADGRPFYGTAAVGPNGVVTVNPCSARIYPQFNAVLMAESAGNMDYRGFFLQVNKRYSAGLQMGASYTYSKATDDAPESNGPDPIVLSDASNRRSDLGSSWGDVRHTFRLSMVAMPKVNTSFRPLSALLNGNQFGLILFADSGERQNVTTNFDLNRDGVTGNPDRPVGIPRNAIRLPAYFNIDLRFSKIIGLPKDRSVEFFAEASNAFNGKYLSGYGSAILSANNVNTSIVNPLTGELRGPLPDLGNGVLNWRTMRQVQVGVKFHF